MVAKTERFEMRLDEDTLARIDGWRAEQLDIPSRAEAIRRLVDRGLSKRTDDTIRLSDGEKLLLLMMGDLFKHLKVKDPKTDAEFISEVIFGGHYWALKWQLPGVFHGHVDDPAHLRLVLDILEMWDYIERGHERLPKNERQRLAAEVPFFGENLRFRGFDDNTEAKYGNIADFLIGELNRYARFAGRDLNAHMPTLDLHQRMLRVFTPMRPTMGGELSLDQLSVLLKAMPYPQ